MKYRVTRLLLLLALALGPCVSAQSILGLRLSPEQKAWVDAHPIIVLGVYDNGWPPLETYRDDRPGGLAFDYLNDAVRRLGLTLEIKTYPSWDQLMQALCNRDVDVVMNLSLTATRTQCMVFTRSYLNVPTALVVSRDTLEATLDPNLKGARLITERGFATEELVRERYPQARYLSAPDTPAALRAVHEGQADAYLGEPNTTQYVIAEQGFTDLVMVRADDLPADSLHFGVPNADQPLAEALDVALGAIPADEFRAIRTRWLPPLEWGSGQALPFTAEERAALAQPLRVAFPLDGEPLSFSNGSGRSVGLSSDYLGRFQSAGANLTLVPTKNWTQIRELMRKKQVDVVFGMPIDPAEDTEWIFSDPFLTVSNVIVARSGSEGILSVRDLDGRRVALSDRQRLTDFIAAQAPRAKVVMEPDVRSALVAVSEGRADAFIGNLAIVDHLLRHEFSGRLAVVAPAQIVDRTAVAVRKDHAPLAVAFNKVMRSMSQREREAIRGDWISVEYRSGMDLSTLLQWLVPLLLVLVTAGIFHGIGYRRVRKEVVQRRKAEQKLDEVASNLPAVVYQAIRHESGTISVPFIVGDMRSLFGISPEVAMASEAELVARVHPEDRPRLLASIENSAANCSPIDVQFRALSSAQTWRWIRSRALPHRTEQGELHWNGYWVDVTELHEQADELSQAKSHAEAAAAAKSDFLAMMSHEIRTPMTGILGMLQVLEHSGLSTEQQRVLGVVDDSANMLRQILDDILDFSKMEAGAVVLHPAPVSLRHLLENVLLLFQTQGHSKGVALECHVDASVAQRHQADATRLRQIFFNLLSNALKFSHKGRILVDVAVYSDEASTQTLAISVSDEGVGISKAQQSQLFRPFTQADEGYGHHGGTGLGLSICKRLVDMMHGEISLWSELGVGTRVDILLPLPLATDSPGEQHEETSSMKVLGTPVRRRVLLVEDHPTNQEVLRWQMEKMQLDAELVDNGKAALAALAKSQFDLMITDCRMPEMDGYQLTRAIRSSEAADPSQRRLPIIALTASAMSDEVHRCIEAGMDACLTKPITLEQLRQALTPWLSVPETAAPPLRPSVETQAARSTADWPDRVSLSQQFGSLAAAQEIIRSLRTHLREDLSQADALITQQDSHGLGERLHRMAGALGAVGANTLAQQARHLSTLVVQEGSVQSDELSALLQNARHFLAHLDAEGQST